MLNGEELITIAVIEGAKKIIHLVADGGPDIWARLFGRTHGEKYLKCSPGILRDFYHNESSLRGKIGDLRYNLPLSFIAAPKSKGSVEKQNISYKLIKEAYTPPGRIDYYTQPVLQELEKQNHYTNGQVVSLRESSQRDKSLQMTMNCGSYYDSLSTNFAMDHKPKTAQKSLREFIHGESGTLLEFTNSPLVNHLGIGCLVESADGFLVASKRASKGVSQLPRSWSISINGVLGYEDICRDLSSPVPEEGTLADIARGVFREGRAELGIQVKDLRFLGMLREYCRGGKPELYFYGRSSKSISDIRESSRKAQEQSEIKGIEGIEFHSDLLTSDRDSILSLYHRIVAAFKRMDGKANLTLACGVILTAEFFLNSIKQETC